MEIETKAIVAGFIIGAAAGFLMGRAAKGGGIATMLRRRGVVR
jgi:hypothetical protein